MKLLIDIPGRANKNHQLRIFQPTSNEEKQLMYQYRYKIYREHNLNAENEEKIDKDRYDNYCVHVLAAFDDQIVGSLRIIYGDAIPTLDYYYKIDLPKIVSETPRKKLFEVGRIISSPYHVTRIIPRHFVLLTMFYYVMLFTRLRHFELVVGSTKHRVVKGLRLVKFPIYEMKNAELIYDPSAHNDPLTLFFDEKVTGKICPVFVPRLNAEAYFNSIYDNHWIFRKIAPNHFKLRSLLLLDALFFLKILLPEVRGT